MQQMHFQACSSCAVNEKPALAGSAGYSVGISVLGVVMRVLNVRS
jgi:hypothetical protein